MPVAGWKAEVNWSRVRFLIRAHVVMWGLGLFLLLLGQFGLLEGLAQTLLGTLALLTFAASLLANVTIFGTPARRDEDGVGAYSFRVFFVFFGFLISSGGFMLLVTALGLNSVSLAD